jgi:hypothetical protein
MMQQHEDWVRHPRHGGYRRHRLAGLKGLVEW